MTKKKHPEAQNPLILRFHRLMDAFAKSDDERDFYLDRIEGFIVFADLDKGLEDIDRLEVEIENNLDRYCLIPKMTFYETKKFMEGFVNEKVYDIDTKEKLLDIIQSKEARENFLEFIYDHLTELEKWQQYYHERSRIRVIEWLRMQEFSFVFEEDLELSKNVLEKVKQHIFETKVPRDVQTARDAIGAKAKTYYSNEALNPRPKRGRPPKQAAKVEIEPQYTIDIYKTVPPEARPFLYMPDFTSTSVTFSAKFDTEAQLIASLRGSSRVKIDSRLEALSQRLESLRHLSDRLRTSSGLGVEKEEKLFEAVSRTGTDPEAGKGSKIADIAKGLLPKKKGRPPKEKAEIQELMKKKREAGIKQVTQIKKKKT
ncbi:UPF0158 family protein [Simkania negevensis]|uniref:UPF0158 protein CPn_0518/CP_0235/CPj0518/CpB0539 n=1 Tax=Simkania negevensis (strain ATCC VR-1471 / DSM 27360 / Z) TaxID=331113 RepID=F8L6S5_SIMNZ|nr:UPF0158 family protein [Simkania negevensis]CCB88423.1 UPF0158 protein CPn_0518/CP_0235/CPj0518/CpB0539 [Simkania negevensis Z]